MVFELNICSAPPPKPAVSTKSKPAPREAPPASTPAVPPSVAAAADRREDAPEPSGANEKSRPGAPSTKRKLKATRPVDAPSPDSTATAAPPSPPSAAAAPPAPAPVPMAALAASQPVAVPPKPAKRARYASAPSSAPDMSSVVIRKDDPSRAAALPATLTLNASSNAAAFSASSFKELPLDQYLQRHLTDRMELSRLTPVQQQAIPALLAGGDLLVRSPTGSGKTLAYAVPVVQTLVQQGSSVVSRAAGTFAIVLVPTRELCLQTHEVVRTLTSPFPWLVTSTLMGGENRKAEKSRLRKGVTLLVGTPGRVADHIESTSSWALSRCAHLVLDEADRLLDLGFRQSIDAILDKLESRLAPQVGRRQTVLLSATLTKGLKELAGRSLQNYATITMSAAGAMQQPVGGPQDSSAREETDVADTVAATAAASAASAGLMGAAAASSEGERLDAPSGLVQSYAFVPTRQKLTALLALVRSKSLGVQGAHGSEAAKGACKMIIFVSSCDGVDFLYELLAEAGDFPNLREAAIAAGHAQSLEDGAEGGQGRWGDTAGAEDGDGGGDDDDNAEWEEGSDGGYHRVEVPGKRKRGDGADATNAQPRRADGLSFFCPLVGNTIVRLHGKMSQRDRTEAFNRFRQLSSGVMIATDVAARGLNLQGVHWIVQQDLPQDAKEYLHRAGRTARIGQAGQAVLLLHPSEAAFLQLLRAAGVSPKELKFASLQAALCPTGSKRDIFVLEVALQKQLEAAVRERAFLQQTATAAYQSYLRSYATHSKAVQRLVHVGQLHLGHLAKSFGLKDIPSKLSELQHKRVATARPERVGSGAAYEAFGDGYVAGGAPRKKLSLAERMKKQPSARKAQAVGHSVAGASEFAAG